MKYPRGALESPYKNAMQKKRAYRVRGRPLHYLSLYSARLLLTTSNTSLDSSPESRMRTSSAFINA